MKLQSSSFEHGNRIPIKYACEGEDTHPPFSISDIPSTAKSLSIIVEDPDAPAGRWIHWTVWNLPPDTKEIKERELPEGAIEGKTSWGKPGYGGPCPPEGTHRYIFTLFALDSMLDLSSSADSLQLEAAMEGRILEKAELMGLYARGGM